MFTESRANLAGRLHVLALTALIALSVIVFNGKSYETTLQAIDSSVYARLALNATPNGWPPKLPIPDTAGRWIDGFNDHPFTLLFVNGEIMRALGPGAWSARLLPGLFSVGCVGLIYWLGSLLFSPVVGLIAGVVLASSPEFIGYGARFHFDTPLTFFILLSFIGFQRRSVALMGIAAGLGIWVKNPVALLLFPSGLLALAMCGQLNRKEFSRLFRAGVLAVVVGALFWVITGEVGGWNLVRDYWSRQVFGTAVGGRGEHITFFLFADILRHRYWPWLPVLLLALFFLIRNRRWRNFEFALPLAGALVTILGISSMNFKFPHYYLPMYPFLALLIAGSGRRWLERNVSGVETALVVASLVAGALLVSNPIALAPEMFPALKRFDAIIQSYGKCSDKVLFVDGGQPYGSFGDYAAEVNFYTGRRLLDSSCGNAAAILGAEKPAWIIVSRENSSKCFKPELLAAYSSRFAMGNQLLLSSIMTAKDSNSAVDLTVLERELKVANDCSPAPLPRDSYHSYE